MSTHVHPFWNKLNDEFGEEEVGNITKYLADHHPSNDQITTMIYSGFCVMLVYMLTLRRLNLYE